MESWLMRRKSWSAATLTRDANDLRRLWDPDFWTEMFTQAETWDRQIDSFNKAVAAA